MTNKAKRKRFLVLIGFIGIAILDILFLLDAVYKIKEKDAIIGWINYLGQPVGADGQLLISIVILILLSICFYFFWIEKEQNKKFKKITGKQKKNARKCDHLQSQNTYRHF